MLHAAVRDSIIRQWRLISDTQYDTRVTEVSSASRPENSSPPKVTGTRCGFSNSIPNTPDLRRTLQSLTLTG